MPILSERRLLLASALLLRGAGAKDCLEQATSYYASDLKDAVLSSMSSAESCESACMASPTCNVWSYLTDTANCWQLPAGTGVKSIANPMAVSGTKLCQTGKEAPVPLQVAVLEESAPKKVPVNLTALTELAAQTKMSNCSVLGKAYNDSSIPLPNGPAVINAEKCQEACHATHGCGKFTFYVTTPGAGDCWLLPKEAPEFDYPAAISGPAYCPGMGWMLWRSPEPTKPPVNVTALVESFARPKCAETGKAYQDETVKEPNGGLQADANACQLACMTSPTCQKFTFYADSMACWLQGKNAKELDSEKAISGPKACEEPKIDAGIQIAFDTHDKNNDGVLDEAEAKKASRDLLYSELQKEPSPELIDATWTQMNSDGTGSVDLVQFQGYMWKKIASEKKAAEEKALSEALKNTKRPQCAVEGTAYNDSAVTSPNLFLADATHCQLACSASASCAVFTYYANTKACWLQGSNSTTFQSKAAISGSRTCPTTAAMLTEMVANAKKPACAFGGKALHDVEVKAVNGGYPEDATHCQAACSTAPSCQVFTYYVDTKACWLQGAGSTTFDSPAAISGAKDCSKPDHAVTSSEIPAGAENKESLAVTVAAEDAEVTSSAEQPPACASTGKAFHDPKVTTVNGGFLPDATHCQKSCSHLVTCKVFTYYVDSKACWLQGADSEVFDSPNAISGSKECAKPAAAVTDVPAGTKNAQITVAPAASVTVAPAASEARLAQDTMRPNCSTVGTAYDDEFVQYPTGVVKANAVDCQASCMLTANCHFFTFYANSGACWLQGSAAKPISNAAAVSGPKACQDATREMLESGVTQLEEVGQRPLLERGAERRPGLTFIGLGLVTLGILSFAYASVQRFKAAGSSQAPRNVPRAFHREEVLVFEPCMTSAEDSLLVPVPAMGFEADMENGEC
eukprot:TRINITY_DN76154_c0_g1_i1.p1 TRINITY_DN76154_c0_g1~~TRINITY_DN76154_c0_g1_i1.p1  ORF type:complete len:935 (+),score=206.57 TRINITY_DN76154_c0_g1_i1:62-2806(+)